MSNWIPINDTLGMVNLDLVCGRFQLDGNAIVFYKPDGQTEMKTVTYSSEEAAAAKYNQLCQRLTAPFGTFALKE